MYAHGSVATSSVLFCEFDSLERLFKIRARDHEFADANRRGAVEDLVEITGVRGFFVMVVEAGVGAVGEVDADLEGIRRKREMLKYE